MKSPANNVPTQAAKKSSMASDALFAQEQRRFRRLEVSLPVWITTEEAFNEKLNVWELGYTRDISLGGTKVIVPPGELEQWKAAKESDTPFVVRIDKEDATSDPIPARIRNVFNDTATGRISLGIQFLEDQAHDARADAVRAGLRTLKARRSWQVGFLVAAIVAVWAGWLGVAIARNLNAQIAARNAKIAQLQKAVNSTTSQIAALEKPTLVSTKTEGIDRAFRGAELKSELATLRANMARLNNPANMQEANAERNEAAKKLGISLASPSSNARVQLAIAFPYGYNWPLVLGDLESALARPVPHVVIFRDWSQDFPDLDAREARARGKVLQITWEPWHFANPGAVRLSDIAAGKYDAYIDKYAASARSFGGELWIRWGHEMNGNWYPWSLSNNGSNPNNWLKAYRRIHDRFRQAGASNVRWIWCFNAENVPAASWNNPYATYPGDSYVDAVAVDGYNFGDTTHYSRWQSFSQIFGGAYDQLVKRYPNKPLYIAETGCASTGGNKATWMNDMDTALRSRFRKVESVTWFEAAKEADWRMVSSLQTAQTARKIWGQTYFRRGVG